jgi:hypothetical protein
VQALSRSVYCFYELRYAFTFNPFAVVSLSSVEFSDLSQFAILVTTELLTPITAVCNALHTRALTYVLHMIF